MKIIIATDSHKGCMTSEYAGNVIASAIKSELPDADISVIPVSDGGEGTTQAIVSYLREGEYKHVTVKDPLGREITAEYGIYGKTAIMEMAAASGLTLLKEDEKDPAKTSTFGTGQMILDAVKSGCSEIIIGIGGSATNDGGAGMAQALGVRFLDSNECEIDVCGGNLHEIRKIDISQMNPDIKSKNVNIRVACDVKNPICGENGASHVFARQKGASEEMIHALDYELSCFAKAIESDLGIDVTELEGGGAAGGLGAGLYAFCGGKLQSGFSIIADILNLDEKIKSADLVITGEGRTDSQTAFGKLPVGIGQIAKKYNIPCVIISGAVSQRGGVSGDVSSLYDYGITAVFSSVTDVETKLSDALANAEANLIKATKNVIRLYHKGNDNKRK